MKSKAEARRFVSQFMAADDEKAREMWNKNVRDAPGILKFICPTISGRSDVEEKLSRLYPETAAIIKAMQEPIASPPERPAGCDEDMSEADKVACALLDKDNPSDEEFEEALEKVSKLEGE